MLNVGGPELLIILLVALVFLGPQRLPELARQLGQTVSSLRSLASGFQAELEAASRPDPDSAMKLTGPTEQSEAIAKTQNGPVTDSPRDSSESSSTDAAVVAKAARAVDHDAQHKPVSSGGPKDLRADSTPDAVDTPGRTAEVAAEKTADASGDDG